MLTLITYISSHNTKLGHATFCWFCDAGSHIIILHSFLFQTIVKNN